MPGYVWFLITILLISAAWYWVSSPSPIPASNNPFEEKGSPIPILIAIAVFFFVVFYACQASISPMHGLGGESLIQICAENNASEKVRIYFERKVPEGFSRTGDPTAFNAPVYLLKSKIFATLHWWGDNCTIELPNLPDKNR